MTQLVSCFILLVLAKVTISAAAPGENFDCGRKNAIKTDCATNCELDKCPVAEHYSRTCNKECKPGCKCRFNEKFAKNGTCIPTQQCPPFPCDDFSNEEYVACPPYCSDDCSQRTCPTFGIFLMVVECFPECRCKQGFNRKAGVCVLYQEC